MSDNTPRRLSCRFFDLSYEASEVARDYNEITRDEFTGSCRRRAPLPTYTGGKGGDLMSSWPSVVSTDWCGEHEVRQ